VLVTASGGERRLQFKIARYKRHSSGTPFSTCVPRSSKAKSEPATRSRTVCETSASPGAASAERTSFAPEDGRGVDIEDTPKRDTAQRELAAALFQVIPPKRVCDFLDDFLDSRHRPYSLRIAIA
jgi:hypothetical protein